MGDFQRPAIIEININIRIDINSSKVDHKGNNRRRSTLYEGDEWFQASINANSNQFNSIEI